MLWRVYFKLNRKTLKSLKSKNNSFLTLNLVARAKQKGNTEGLSMPRQQSHVSFLSLSLSQTLSLFLCPPLQTNDNHHDCSFQPNPSWNIEKSSILIHVLLQKQNLHITNTHIHSKNKQKQSTKALICIPRNRNT